MNGQGIVTSALELPRDRDRWPGQVILALEAVVRVGKVDDGKRIMEKLGGRAMTVEQVWRMRFPIPSLSPNPDQWMAQVLLSRCKDDMGTCAPNLAAWAVEVIQKGGKAQDAKALLDALKARARTVGQARQIVGQLAGLAQRDTVRWAADVLQSSAQGDLATCGLGEPANERSMRGATKSKDGWIGPGRPGTP